MVTHSSILSWENPWTEQPGSLPSGSAVKHLPAMQETRGSIPGSEGPPEEGTGNPLQYSCPENPMD